jgi:hypothetical protein
LLRAKLALILPVLLLTACGGQPLAPAVSWQQPRGYGPARGVDLPTDASDILNELKGSRLDFVARYYREPTSRWPTLTPQEAQRVSSLGLKIVAVWESHSHRPEYFSYASGYADAMNAYRQAASIGQPNGSAIYFAVDFDARREALNDVDQYFRGIAAGFAASARGKPQYKVGVYGSGAVCDAVKRAGLAQYSWLSNSTAWAGYSGYRDWNIKQGGRLGHLSFNHDLNEAKDDYGSFRLAQSETPAPYIAGR